MQLQYVYKSNSEQDTAGLAERLAHKAEPGSVIVLNGDLGAGKTRFAQAYARAMGVAETVNSPTFVLIKEYDGQKLPFYHMDVYRLSMEEADELGLEEYFDGDGVTLVEWGELIEELLPAERLEIRIERQGEEARLICCTPMGERYLAWCEAIGGELNLERREDEMNE